MRIFLSYASDNRSVAERICLALQEAGHSVFFDKTGIPAGEPFNSLIRKEIRRSDRFVFLISPESVVPGRYTLTEVKLVQEKWPHPRGKVLPVMIESTDTGKIPNYLRAVNILEPAGDAAAEVVNALVPRFKAGRLLLAGSALVAAGLAAALYLPDLYPPAFDGKDRFEGRVNKGPVDTSGGRVNENPKEERFGAEVERILAGPWKTEGGIDIPQDWISHQDLVDKFFPAPGTILDQAGFLLEVTDEFGPYQGETKFYKTENVEERGYILTHTDQAEALGEVAKASGLTDDFFSHLNVLSQRNLRFRIGLFEGGSEIESEPVDILKDEKDDRIIVRVMLRPTVAKDLYAEEAEPEALRYTQFNCSAKSEVGEKLVADFCIALLERTLIKREFS